jgi:superfamily I DNA/RNA helicase
LERNEIHSSDSGVLCSKIEVLRAVDFSIRTIKHENTTIAFESQEEYLENKDNNDKIEELRRLRKNHFYMKTGTIKLSTVHSFKGWEIDTLFLFIQDEEGEKEFENAELIYTGLTRARKNLVIFNLGNKKYDNFFKQEIDAKFEHH